MLLATASRVEQTMASCEEALRAPSVAPIAARLVTGGRSRIYELVRAVTGEPDTVVPLARAREEVVGEHDFSRAAEADLNGGHAFSRAADADLNGGHDFSRAAEADLNGGHDFSRAAETDREFARSVILLAATEGLKRLPEAPLPQSVKTRICEEMDWLAAAPTEALGQCRVGTSAFERLCRIATLRRFPAGLFEWEVSGIPRSYCLQTGITAWPRVAAFVALRMKGFAPVFFSHLGARSIGRSMDEREANRSYYRMAMALKQQPEVLGFGACSWFRAPSTHRVSPHLAWLSNVFRENGGIVVDAGPDDPNGGVLYRSATRRALYESGKWKPRRGLVMWPRAAMLAWAKRHPELADDCDEL